MYSLTVVDGEDKRVYTDLTQKEAIELQSQILNDNWLATVRVRETIEFDPETEGE